MAVRFHNVDWECKLYDITDVIVIVMFLLGAFTKLRKATSSFVVSLLVFVHIERLGTYWKDFDKI